MEIAKLVKTNKRYLIGLVLAVLVFSGACFTLSQLNRAKISEQEKNLTFETVSMGSRTRYDVQDFLVITEAKEWDKFWEEKSFEGTITASDVDFQNYFAIAAFLGEKATGGFGIHIENIAQSKTIIKVTINITEPGPGQYVTEGNTRPYHIVRVKKCDMPQMGNITFIFVDTSGEELAIKSYCIDKM